jgi:hypothetical protein
MKKLIILLILISATAGRLSLKMELVISFSLLIWN